MYKYFHIRHYYRLQNWHPHSAHLKFPSGIKLLQASDGILTMNCGCNFLTILNMTTLTIRTTAVLLTLIHGCFKTWSPVILWSWSSVNMPLMSSLASTVTVSHSGDGNYNKNKNHNHFITYSSLNLAYIIMSRVLTSYLAAFICRYILSWLSSQNGGYPANKMYNTTPIRPQNISHPFLFKEHHGNSIHRPHSAFIQSIDTWGKSNCCHDNAKWLLLLKCDQYIM